MGGPTEQGHTMNTSHTGSIPVDLAAVADDGRVAIEVRNNGEDVVLDLEVIAGFDRQRVLPARQLHGDAAPIDRLDPGDSVTLVVDDTGLTDAGLMTMVSYFRDGKVHRAVTSLRPDPAA